jgi:hypothetical protein
MEESIWMDHREIGYGDGRQILLVYVLVEF